MLYLFGNYNLAQKRLTTM